MKACRELARFRGDDDPRLVAASLACPVCLRSETTWTLGGGPWESWADCECAHCGHPWSLGLTPDQALRLSLDRARALIEA